MKLIKARKKEYKEMIEMENISQDQELKLSPPWITYYNEVKALFGQDPNVRVEFDKEGCKLKLFVAGSDKCNAIRSLLPENISFGNVQLTIMVIPQLLENPSNIDLLGMAFVNNPVLKYTATAETMFGKKYYAVFQKDIAQFFNDEMNDLHGVRSMLYADVAKDVFTGVDDVLFNTDSDDMVSD